MNEQTAVGVYDAMEKVEDAIRTLHRADFPIDRVSVVAKDLHSEKEVHGYISAADISKTGAGTGAWLGGVFGILIGAAFVWAPGFGPLMVAGPFAAALLGGIEGAIAGAAGGGLLGGLIGWGVSRKHILKYEDHLRGGSYLLVVHGSSREVERAHEILGGTHPKELTMHDPSEQEPAHVESESVGTADASSRAGS